MREGPDIATLAAAIGDPARAGMLDALTSGLALSAGELAREAGITPPTASTHLAHLRDLGIVVMAWPGATLRIVGVLWVLGVLRPGRRRGQQQRAGHGPQRGSQAGQGARAHQLRSSPSWRASYTASVLELTLSLP